ncbi:MAG: hypothetical protein ACI8T1_000607 [Verrucomicrobiales bacterium]|jgi:hypothetical protein
MGVKNLSGAFRQYERIVGKEEITEWKQIDLVRNLSELNRRFGGEDVTTLYSFISPEQRKSFPDGELMMIKSRPSPFPGGWKSRHPFMHWKWKDHPSYKPIRFLMIRADDGEMRSDW